MNLNAKSALIAATCVLLAGCQHTAGLRSEVDRIEARLKAVEGEIAQGTSSIGLPGKDIRTRVAYRPLVNWAGQFGTKTATFRQSDRGGDLARKDMECKYRFPFGGTFKAGYRVWIHEDKSTKVDFTLGPLEVVPNDAGLRLNAQINAWAKTQIAGAGRPPCTGWSPTVTVGAEGRTRAKSELELKLDQSNAFSPRYELAIVSPKKLDVEFRTGFKIPGYGDVDVKRTFEVDNFTGTLASGTFDLLVENEGEIVLPGGEIRKYRLKTVNPELRTDRTGVALDSDVELQRDAN